MTFHLAYIDPGTGSVILQAVIGAVAGIAYAVRHRLAIIWAKLTGKQPPQDHKPAAKPTKPKEKDPEDKSSK